VELSRKDAEIFVPDGLEQQAALARTTHLAVAAHQDDLEIMALDGILQAFQSRERWFCGIVTTDGAGSPRAGVYRDYTDESLRAVRRLEQRKAAFVGEYGAQVFLNHPSSTVKDGARDELTTDLVELLRAAQPRIVYTHNLADRHDTHVAVALRLVAALRRLPRAQRPERLFGCEVWRDLDWLQDNERVVFDLSRRENLQAALLGIFDSQISGGKRYDLATLGRRRAHATYLSSHATDSTTGAALAMDLTPLLQDDSLDPSDLLRGHLHRFADDVVSRLERLAR
jgi:LmbE family N-acetylglucosaminyl deacetylase